MPRRQNPMSVPDTHVLVIADRSGSMNRLRDIVITQLNSFLQDRKGDPGIVTVSLFTFDDQFDTVFEEVPAADVREITKEDYAPRGSTALYDAIARATTDLETRVKAGERVLVNIITDGQENASKEYSLYNGGKGRIKALIERLQGQGNWTFTYASADMNAFADAAQIGIFAGNINQFAPSAAGFAANNVTMRRSTMGYTQSAVPQMDSFYSGDS